jgi:hypothetical protein
MQRVLEILGLFLWHSMTAHALKKCPLTVRSWNTASMALQCQTPNYYHCIRDENGQITQQCLQRVWIQPGNECLQRVWLQSGNKCLKRVWIQPGNESKYSQVQNYPAVFIGSMDTAR